VLNGGAAGVFGVVGHTVRAVLFTPRAATGLSQVWLVGDPAGGSGAGVGSLAEFYFVDLLDWPRLRVFSVGPDRAAQDVVSDGVARWVKVRRVVRETSLISKVVGVISTRSSGDGIRILSGVAS